MDPVPMVAGPSSTAKMSTTIAAHPTIVLVMLTILIILVIGMYVYYHGVFSIGPYAGKKANFTSGAAADAEAEKLISSINAA